MSSLESPRVFTPALVRAPLKRSEERARSSTLVGMHDVFKALVGVALALVLGCDPIMSVQGRVVQTPQAENANTKAPIANATVNVTCEYLKPDEGITTKTDANGAFTMSTAGGGFSDKCILKVTPPGAYTPIVTTIGATKTPNEDPKTGTRQVEIGVTPPATK